MGLRTPWEWHVEIKKAQAAEMRCIGANEIEWHDPNEDRTLFPATLPKTHVGWKDRGDMQMICNTNREIVTLKWFTSGNVIGGVEIGFWKGTKEEGFTKRTIEFVVIPQLF